VGLQPVADSVESVSSVCKYVSDKPVGFIGIAIDKVPVGPQEGVGGKEGCTLVSVKEWMVCSEAFKESGCFFEEIVIVPRWKTPQSGFQGVFIQDTRRSPKRSLAKS